MRCRRRLSVVAIACALASIGGEAAPADGARAWSSAGDLQAWGHSVVKADYGALTPFPSTVAATLERTVTNNAVSGSELLNRGEESWGNILQLTSTGVYGAARHQPPPFSPVPEISLIMTGLNDVANSSDAYPGGAQGAAFLGAYKQSLRTVISRFRATAIHEESDPTVSYRSAWKTTASQAYSGSGYASSTTPGSPITIAVPSAFPGGTVAFGTMATDPGGARWTFTVDGQPAGAASTAGTALGGEPVGIVERLTGLAAGAHTIVATPAAVAGTPFLANFDYWQIEPPNPESVVVLLQYKPLSYAGYKGVSPHVPTDADIDALNGQISALASEFAAGDARVIPIALGGMDHNADYAWGDGLHPNQAGLDYIASQVVAAIAPGRTIVKPAPSPAAPAATIFTVPMSDTAGPGATEPVSNETVRFLSRSRRLRADRHGVLTVRFRVKPPAPGMVTFATSRAVISYRFRAAGIETVRARLPFAARRALARTGRLKLRTTVVIAGSRTVLTLTVLPPRAGI